MGLQQWRQADHFLSLPSAWFETSWGQGKRSMSNSPKRERTTQQNARRATHNGTRTHARPTRTRAQQPHRPKEGSRGILRAGYSGETLAGEAYCSCRPKPTRACEAGCCAWLFLAVSVPLVICGFTMAPVCEAFLCEQIKELKKKKDDAKNAARQARKQTRTPCANALVCWRRFCWSAIRLVGCFHLFHISVAVIALSGSQELAEGRFTTPSGRKEQSRRGFFVCLPGFIVVSCAGCLTFCFPCA